MTDSHLHKILLVSSRSCYGFKPGADEEVKQRLTLHIDGRVWVSRYQQGTGHQPQRIETRRHQMHPSMVGYMISSVHSLLASAETTETALDAGTWELLVVYRSGRKQRRRGLLMPSQDEGLASLSEAIRVALGEDGLFAFDGRARLDILEGLTLDYHRTTRIRPSVPISDSIDVVTWEYSEHLCVDRATESVELVQAVGEQCRITKRYEVADGVAELLNELGDRIGDQQPVQLKDFIQDPNESKEYELTLTYRKSGTKVFSGTFDIDGLPTFWAEFAETLFSFITFYGMGEVLSPSAYNARRRRASDMMFLSVVFQEYGQEYCYLSDDESIQSGDFVHVPVGLDNRRATAEVVAVKWLQKDESPIPFEKVKTILGKVDGEQA